MDYKNYIGIPVDDAIEMFKAKGIFVRLIKHIRPIRACKNYTREMVVRVDNIEDDGVILVTGLFPDLKRHS